MEVLGALKFRLITLPSILPLSIVFTNVLIFYNPANSFLFLLVAGMYTQNFATRNDHFNELQDDLIYRFSASPLCQLLKSRFGSFATTFSIVLLPYAIAAPLAISFGIFFELGFSVQIALFFLIALFMQPFTILIFQFEFSRLFVVITVFSILVLVNIHNHQSNSGNLIDFLLFFSILNLRAAAIFSISFLDNDVWNFFLPWVLTLAFMV